MSTSEPSRKRLDLSCAKNALRARADEADDRLRRLCKMEEDSLAKLDDLLKDRLAALKADWETAHAAFGRARGINRSDS